MRVALRIVGKLMVGRLGIDVEGWHTEIPHWLRDGAHGLATTLICVLVDI